MNFLVDYDFMKTATVADIEREIGDGADVNAKDENGETALYLAEKYNESPNLVEIIKLLKSYGAK